MPFGDHHNPGVDLTNQGHVHFNLTHGSLGHQYGSQIVSQPSNVSQMRDISNKFDCKKLPTSVNISVLQFYLHNYDRNERKFILSVFSEGFSVSCDKSTYNLECKNLLSANQQPGIVKDKICKELVADRFAGPFLSPLFDIFTVSPLGLCPKKEPNKFRLIHHLSYPKGNSVNDYIAKEFSSVQYTPITDAIAGIKKFKSPC